MPAPLFNTIEERFLSLTTRPDKDCWICSMIDSSTRYGRFPFKGKQYYAHRVAWELYVGKIPNGMFVLHKCDNPPCCNPHHLFLGTDKDNSSDKVNKGRQYHPIGELSNRAVLTDDEVRTIRKLLSSGYSHRDIADGFNVTKSTITRIGNGSGWSHIT